VTTFIDRTGGIFDALGGGRYPNSVFLDAQGEVVDPPADWPASTR